MDETSNRGQTLVTSAARRVAVGPRLQGPGEKQPKIRSLMAEEILQTLLHVHLSLEEVLVAATTTTAGIAGH